MTRRSFISSIPFIGAALHAAPIPSFPTIEMQHHTVAIGMMVGHGIKIDQALAIRDITPEYWEAALKHDGIDKLFRIQVASHQASLLWLLREHFQYRKA